MDANFNSLPPLKRFRLLQQQEQQQQQQLCQPEPKPESEPEPKSKALPLSPSNLPAKKRKYARDYFFDFNDEKENIPPSITPPTPYCLPAKKRIWAFKPEFSPIKSPPPSLALPIDLNLEYDPSVESKMEGEDGEEESGRVEIEVEGDGEEEEAEDDDGILCVVCESTDGDPSDPIVFCDGCDLMVHSSCYGNPLVKGIPEGEWFCAQCSDSNSRPLAHKCCLCPVTKGAMKPTSDGRWAHIVCALLVPEVFFGDPEGRDGIDCSKIPKKRWRDRCYLCKQTKGCAIECSEPKCPLAFHVTCGLQEDLTIELKEGKNTGGIVAGFCKKHTELWKKQKQTGMFKIVARDEE
ncbi:protein Jade-1-like [Chenopodium quinoa]|nr:protein Jade-1-like [Chenopodium quinoa]